MKADEIKTKLLGKQAYSQSSNDYIFQNLPKSLSLFQNQSKYFFSILKMIDTKAKHQIYLLLQKMHLIFFPKLMD